MDERSVVAGGSSGGRQEAHSHGRRDAHPQVPFLLPLSAETAAALADAARLLIERLERESAPRLLDVCYMAGVGSPHRPFRAAVVADDRAEIVDALRAVAAGSKHAAVRVAPASNPPGGKVAFVFPGQGSQWLGMGRELLTRDGAFRDALNRCDEAVAREARFSVVEELQADEGRSRLERIDVVQPTLWAMQVALAAQWRAWGVNPDAVVGHSLGEVAAAHAAGILSLQDAARVICRRSALLREVSGRGGMGLVELTSERANAVLRGYEDRLSVAASNSPRSTVLAGDVAALEEVLSRLKSEGVFCRMVKVDVASHSPQVEPQMEPLEEQLRGLSPRAASVPMRSTVTGDAVEGRDLVGSYWAQNLRRPVLFAHAVQRLIEEGHTTFVDVSPHPVLLTEIQENLKEMRVEGVAVASLRRDKPERRSLLQSLGALYAGGYPVAFERLYPHGSPLVSPGMFPHQLER